jgi:hypothetical protein
LKTDFVHLYVQVYSREILIEKIDRNEVECSLQDIVPADDIAQLLGSQVGTRDDEVYVWTGKSE